VKRYHQELDRTKRTHRRHVRQLHQWPERQLDCVCEFQVGRFRKKKALGCGKPRCLLCHYSKILGIDSIQDRVRHQRFIESMREYLAE
jgi:hypothetical protein